MNRKEIQVRAHAMRIADVLSRVEFEKKPAIGSFGNAPPFGQWPEIDLDCMLPSHADMEFMLDDGAQPAIWPIDLGVIFEDTNGMIISFVRSVPLARVRGFGRRISRYVVQTHTVKLDRFGSIIEQWGGFYSRIAKTWVNVADDVGAPSTNPAPLVVIGAALRHRYEWAAVFSFPTGIKLRFGCSAAGALDLFRDRDSPEEGRRAALLHWVRKHWRRTSDAAEARSVRQHLRGVTEINWRGQAVSILPAEYEIEQAA